MVCLFYMYICRYKKLLSSVDLTKDFFYSYTYPIMQSLQKNVISIADERMPYENIFVWNAFLTEAIRSRCNNTIWTIALVHGNFKQVSKFQFLIVFYDLFVYYCWVFQYSITVTRHDTWTSHLFVTVPDPLTDNWTLWRIIRPQRDELGILNEKERKKKESTRGEETLLDIDVNTCITYINPKK